MSGRDQRPIGLRRRVFLLCFALFASMAGLVVLVAILLSNAATPEARVLLVRFAVVTIFAGVVTSAAVWIWLDTHIARPLDKLARYGLAAAHGDRPVGEPVPTASHLGLAGPAVAALSFSLQAAKSGRDEAVGGAIARAERQTARLETVLHDLREGIVICTRDHFVLFYNPRAAEILKAIGPLGLRRPIFDLLSADPVGHSLVRLEKRFREKRHLTHPDGVSLSFAALCTDSRTTVEAMMTLVRHGDLLEGYILSFSDETEILAASAEAERQLIALAVKIREEAASLHLVADLLDRVDGLPSPGPALIETMVASVADLAVSADALDRLAMDHLARAWPMGAIAAATLFDLVIERARMDQPVAVAADPRTLILCDSAAIATLLARLSEWLARRGGQALFLACVPEAEMGFVDLAFTGDEIRIRDLSAFLDKALDHDLGPVTARDVLARHATDIWPERLADGGQRLRMPLEMRDASRVRALPIHWPERRPSYDFDLFDDRLPDDLAATPLDRLTAVVFDTETTGLEPSRGDRMVSISGVRLVNGRIIAAEVFNTFVNPERPIPPASTLIHGITDAMVADAPPAVDVVRRFRDFARDAVLVAHNAPFDMRFLVLAGEMADIGFTNPVLDTVLLAAHLHGTEGALTLDRLAETYGVDLPEESRHTAYGDAMATAAVFTCMLKPLAAAGVVTLEQAIRASEAQSALRRRQSGY